MGLIPHRIYEARLAAGMTQADLAYHLRQHGVPATDRNIRRWETGANEPRASVIPAIAEATGKPIAWFFDADAPFQREAA